MYLSNSSSGMLIKSGILVVFVVGDNDDNDVTFDIPDNDDDNDESFDIPDDDDNLEDLVLSEIDFA